MPRGARAFDGARLRAARRAARLPLRAIAERSGLSVTHVHRIEDGQHAPAVHVIADLARALDVPVTQLLRRDCGFAYLRAIAGKTQADVAADVGLSTPAIGRLECGTRVHVDDDLAARLAASLHCSIAAVHAAHQHARRAA